MVSARILKEYPNGASAISHDGKIIYIRYNTGDKVWFEDGKVVKIQTADGIEREYELE